MRVTSAVLAAGVLLVVAPGPASAQEESAEPPVTTTTAPPSVVPSTSDSAPSSAANPTSEVRKAQESSATTTTTTTTAPQTCELTPTTVGKGDLLWGFKKSFRQYVGVGIGGAAGNSITATDGATITAVDEVVRDGKPNPTGVPTGAYRFSFQGAEFRTRSDFTAHYRGKVEFSYPTHFFTLVLKDPSIKVSGATATMQADIALRADPGAPAQPVDLPDVALANLDLGGGNHTGAAGSLSWTGVPSTLTSAEAFASFYQAGTALDPVDLAVAADCAKLPEGPPAAPPGATPPAQAAGGGGDLVPEVRHRPAQQLANTGSDVEDVLWLGVSLLLAGTAVLLAAYRPARR
ncbi:HtaA domain-containing protein [Actinosynnema mirum]|uniref:LPXTG-motif cell wall anchor domain protein n=1 Tax=Actinosynnema mirum (strain ATCC 29888 / DSM 43827 / JCM 3225 / NBRC 14064 / NCIMB 13271 / NRRL B-12336 / IMRU 3971 / 101) TaxID=446462 RepID=C6WQF1_ACTMD|nr:HtaA domain-containing protein [Actinosynnema mirum]ACU36805.1 LPXTG-motif cell wall anchor domain protein [Actinosynnema mirum DSM 43827]